MRKMIYGLLKYLSYDKNINEKLIEVNLNLKQLNSIYVEWKGRTYNYKQGLL